MNGILTTLSPSTRAIEEKKDSDSCSLGTNIKMVKLSEFIFLEIISHRVSVNFFYSLVSEIYWTLINFILMIQDLLCLGIITVIINLFYNPEDV